ncbi:hypothetical protein C0J52_00121 [Blattella germanica]|nr:hypothetical protein C0J52_00121 [Blattella germanica]
MLIAHSLDSNMDIGTNTDMFAEINGSKKRRNYDPETKKEIVAYAAEHGVAAAAKRYNVHDSCIRLWRKILKDTLTISEDSAGGLPTASSDKDTVNTKKRRILDLETKKQIVLYAIEHGNRAAGRHYEIPESCIRGWRKSMGDTVNTPSSTDLTSEVSSILKEILMGSKPQPEANAKTAIKRNDLKASNIPWDVNLTRELNKYISSSREKGVSVLLDEMLLKVCDVLIALNVSRKKLQVTEDWIERYLQHMCGSLNCEISLTPKVSKDLLMKIKKYKNFVQQLRKKYNYPLNQMGNVNRIQIYLEYPLEIDKSITILLCVTADGSKLKPFIVFKSKSVLKNAFPNSVIVCTDADGNLTDVLMSEWYKSVWCCRPGAEQNVRGLLTFESNISHLLTEDWLADGNTDLVIVPRDMTSLPQPLDVHVTKYFKDKFREECEKWILSNGKLKSASPSVLSHWIAAAWDQVPEELVIHSFMNCHLSTSLDGTEDMGFPLTQKFVTFENKQKLPGTQAEVSGFKDFSPHHLWSHVTLSLPIYCVLPILVSDTIQFTVRLFT